MAVNDAEIIKDVAEGVQESTGYPGFDVHYHIEEEENPADPANREQAREGDEISVAEESPAAVGDPDEEDRERIDADNAEPILGKKIGGAFPVG